MQNLLQLEKFDTFTTTFVVQDSLVPWFLFFCEGFPLRPLPSLQRTQEKGIHRRDAENFEFLFDDGHRSYDARRTEHECS